jgi:deazaflavin-dependent oxidoreductase (nitroreductase family)
MVSKAVGRIRSALTTRGQLFGRSSVSREIMTPEEHITDSPKGWVRSHIHDYVQSAGKKGHRWRGLPTLLLTTRGRRSGLLRRTALIYGQDVASNGGASRHPFWYLNLVENPDVELQVGAQRFRARARAATTEEKPRLWRLMTTIFPHYDTYQAKADRDIPVIVVEPL